MEKSSDGVVLSQGETLRHNVSSSGEFILSLLDGESSYRQICCKLKSQFGVLPEGMERDIAQFLWQLEDLGLVEWLPSFSESPEVPG